MEIFKPIPNYPNYEVSNLGRVYSKNRNKTLKAAVNGAGYYNVVLSNKGVSKTFTVHQLVAITFLNHKPNGLKFVINHKDLDKLNNNVTNLEVVSNRANTSHKITNSTSKNTGVSWDKNSRKWRVTIKINGNSKHLGLFTDEVEASIAYQNKLKSL